MGLWCGFFGPGSAWRCSVRGLWVIAVGVACGCSSTAGPTSERVNPDPLGGMPEVMRSGRADAIPDGRTPDSVVPPAPAPAAGSESPPVGEPCASAQLAVTRKQPTVWLMIDGSGSMNDGFTGFGTESRWSVLRETLVGPGTGVVARLEGSVAFGLMIYDGGVSPPTVYVPGICPRVIVVEPALNNLAAITAAYPALPTGASTPTHYALEDLSQRIMAASPSPSPSSSGPTYVLLATDGKPNLCDFHDGIPASFATEQQAVDTVAALAGRGIQTFAVSMAGADTLLQAHLDAVAQAGATGQTTAFSPSSRDGLAQTLGDIVGDVAGCEVEVEGMIVPGRECEGSVTLNGERLSCTGGDGFRLKDEGRVLELLGTACETLQAATSATVEAEFACEDVVLL